MKRTLDSFIGSLCLILWSAAAMAGNKTIGDPCKRDTDCIQGSLCVKATARQTTAICMLACPSGQCLTGETCLPRSGDGAKICMCDANHPCNAGLPCIQGLCPGFFYCHPTANPCPTGAPLTCLRPNPKIPFGLCLLTCLSHQDCPPPGTRCLAYQSQKACYCLKDSDCPTPLVCTDYHCHVKCTTDTDCKPWERCGGGVCEPRLPPAEPPPDALTEPTSEPLKEATKPTSEPTSEPPKERMHESTHEVSPPQETSHEATHEPQPDLPKESVGRDKEPSLTAPERSPQEPTAPQDEPPLQLDLQRGEQRPSDAPIDASSGERRNEAAFYESTTGERCSEAACYNSTTDLMREPETHQEPPNPDAQIHTTCGCQGTQPGLSWLLLWLLLGSGRYRRRGEKQNEVRYLRR